MRYEHEFDDVMRTDGAHDLLRSTLRMRSNDGWELVDVAVLSDRTRHYWKRPQVKTRSSGKNAGL